MELGLFLLPISIIHYLPNFFFGSLLMLFGVEILMDWLIHSFKKVSLNGPARPHTQPKCLPEVYRCA